jgi:TPR repeat protein
LVAPSAVSFSAERPLRPYPGLRPFEAYEWSIFFGRERMVEDVIERLAVSGLVMVHGASGAGKSSLIRAGVLPKMARQHLRHGAPWLTAAMRPSGGPLWNLAVELAKLRGEGDNDKLVGEIVGRLSVRGATLANVAGGIGGLAGSSLCLLVDQFEELFRFEKETSREEAEVFVELIGAAARQGETPVAEGEADVRVVVTMRSEFLGDCARFDGLAETINKTQYLVPRMDEDALLRAVRRPASMYGGTITEETARRLIGPVRGREDELPLLQHGLMLMWEDAVRRTQPGHRIVIDGDIVDAAGGLAELLSQHADSILAAVAPDPRRQALVERLFRALTDVNAEGSAIRRPRRFADLAAEIGASKEELRPILDGYRAIDASFITPYAPTPIADATLIDISHEALIRCWGRIAAPNDGWLKREFDDGLAWRSLLVEGRAFAKDESRVLSPSATVDRGSLYAARNESWSQRYGGGWEQVGALLTASRTAAARARRRSLITTITLATISFCAVVMAIGLSFTVRQEDVALKSERLALRKADEATAQANKATADAVKAQHHSDEQNAVAQNLVDQVTQGGKRCPSAAGIVVTQDLLQKMTTLANEGDGRSLFTLGLFIICDNDMPDHDNRAASVFEQGAAAGDSGAMDILGEMHRDGQAYKKEPGVGLQWFLKAAAAGSPRAMGDLGDFYANEGMGVPVDFVKSREWYEKGAALGDAHSMTGLGIIYQFAQGVKRDYAAARDWYQRAADQKDVPGMRRLGILYDNAEYNNDPNPKPDYDQARTWYQAAADAGDVDAMWRLGYLYDEGLGSAGQDEVKARFYYQKAAENGNIDAMNNIGALYDDGLGVEQDYEQARIWYTKAANQNDARANTNLGVFYEDGKGVEQSYQKAFGYYQIAANLNDDPGMRRLGRLYETGHGTTRDYKKAMEWYQKSAAAGNTLSMRYIGGLYLRGLGVPVDVEQARVWYKKSADAGDIDSKNALAEFNFEARKLEVDEASGDQLYEKALQLRQALANDIEADETKTSGQPGIRTATALGQVSWDALEARNFQLALDASERAIQLAPDQIWLNGNRAHALMMLERTNEASALYIAYRNERIFTDGSTQIWRTAVLDDFRELRKAGISHPLMAKVEAALHGS